MKTIYWAPWGHPSNELAERFLSYSDPVNVLQDLQSSINKENKSDNFLNCPAFVNQYKNAYLFIEDNKKILKIKPEKYKGVCFDGQPHYFKFPKSKIRLVVVFTFN